MNWRTRRFSKRFLHSILNLNFSFSLNNVTTGHQISQCFWMDLRNLKDLFVVWEFNCLHLCGWGRASEETHCWRITQRRPDAGVACKKAKLATSTAVTCFSRFSSLGVRERRSPWRARIFLLELEKSCYNLRPTQKAVRYGEEELQDWRSYQRF